MSAELDQFYAAHQEAVHRFLYRLTGNASDADDLLQETFFTYWRKSGQYRGEGAPLAYLRRIAFRLYLNQRTRQKRRAALAPVPEERHETTESIERDDAIAFLLERVHEVLDSLPRESRDAFLMFRFEGMTCAEIALTTETPVKTVESRVRRATLLLAERLRRYEEHLPRS